MTFVPLCILVQILDKGKFSYFMQAMRNTSKKQSQLQKVGLLRIKTSEFVKKFFKT
jgi:hypothetical protein